MEGAQEASSCGAGPEAFTVTPFALAPWVLAGIALVQDPTAQARAHMVELIARQGVKDARVLEAMRRVPRHKLVPKELSDEAYTDKPLPIGFAQTISQPYIVAYMSELAAVAPGEKVLEIGTGSGYQAAVLAELGARVFTIELIPELAERARKDLVRLGYDKVTCKTGDGYRGWREEAPFDAVLLTAAPTEVPKPLLDQLAEGGVLVAPVGPAPHQALEVHEKKNGKLHRRRTIDVRFVPMRGEAERAQRGAP